LTEFSAFVAGRGAVTPQGSGKVVW
jgi:hypothetical protein